MPKIIYSINVNDIGIEVRDIWRTLRSPDNFSELPKASTQNKFCEFQNKEQCLNKLKWLNNIFNRPSSLWAMPSTRHMMNIGDQLSAVLQSM